MKQKLILLILSVWAISSNAQQLTSFVRFNAGLDFSKGYGAKVEYGKSRNWLELSLSMGFYNSLPLRDDYMAIEQDGELNNVWGKEKDYYLDGKLNLSLMLNASVDVVKLLFKSDSKHGLKLGAGVGPTYYHHRKNVFNSPNSNQKLLMSHDMTFDVFDYTLRASYEYTLNNKLSIGAFFEKLGSPEEGLFGVSVKRSF
ncbi:hypothetical protein LJC72_13380 [Bacteroides sp. OttesenSCG-928-D19]|nr:hypothetical protein [Bacteroides sp. OttesenSCG-928-D19]